MNRAVDWTPLVADGDDPVPGEPGEVSALGTRFLDVAAVIRDSATKLRDLAADGDMRSEAVEAFREQARITAEQVSRAEVRYEGSGRALVAWAHALAEAQHESLAARDQAEAARSDMTRQLDQARLVGDQLAAAPPGSDTNALQGTQRAAQLRVDGFEEALSGAQGRLARALAARGEAARRAARDIAAAGERSGLEDSVADDAAEATKVVVEWADRIALGAGTLALAVGWIPVVGQAAAAVLGSIAALAGIVGLAGNIYLMIKGDAEWHDVLLSALGAVSFGLGKLAVAGLKTSIQGARGASRLAAGKLEAHTSGAERRALTQFRLASGLSKNQARRLTEASRDLPRLFAPARLRTVFGEIQRDTVGNARTLWNADWGRAWAELKAPGRWGGDGSFDDTFRRVMGERSSADEIAELDAIPQNIREHPDMVEQFELLAKQETAFRATGGYALVDLFGVQTMWAHQWKDMVFPPPEDVLELPSSPEVLPAPAAPSSPGDPR